MIGWWRSLPFRRQIFIAVTVALFSAIAVLEFLVEPGMERTFAAVKGEIDWHEVPLWLFVSVAAGIGTAAVFSRAVMRRLKRIARATEQIRQGNLSIRIPVAGSSDDIFNKLSRSFNAMAETIDTLLHNERRLLSDISHEIRAPLARVGAGVELLLARNSSNANTGYLRKIERDLAQMNHLVNALLEQGGNRLAIREGRKRLDLSAIAAEEAESFQMQGITQKKELCAEINPEIQIEGHPMQARIIIENILANALFYTPENSRVEIRLRRVDRFARLTVRDHGPGIPEDKLDAIFQPLFRIDPSRGRHSGGIGLGLTLVREACQALGGSVGAKNRSPGLEVTVLLPIA